MTENVDVKPLTEVLVPEAITEETFREIERAAFASPKQLEELRDLLRAWDENGMADRYRTKTENYLIRGYCHYLNGEIEKAEELLRQARNDPWGYYWLVRLVLDTQRWNQALSLAERARERFPDHEPLAWLVAEVWIQTGWETEAEKLLEELASKNRDSAHYHFLKGLLAERRGEYEEAMDHYRRATDLDPDHVRALFRLGYLASLYGEVTEAIGCWRACVEKKPVPVNALINLGLLYEDLERYQDAIACYRMVLKYYPNHPRARLYLGDAEASTSMYYDREKEKERSRQNQILRIPISDFELSVRSRNCLEKMNIKTLGDLIMKTEEELLSYKNFGNTSLGEIKAILAQKGLRLGQGLEKRKREEERSHEEVEKGVDPEILDRPIESLNLSIRSRRCMDRLNIRTIRDLIHKTELELMSAKNFGTTSLEEVKQKLGKLGLKLRG